MTGFHVDKQTISGLPAQQDRLREDAEAMRGYTDREAEVGWTGPEFPHEPNWKDVISPTSLLRDTTWKVTQADAALGVCDPFEVVLNRWSATGPGCASCADVYRNVAMALWDAGSNVMWAAQRLEEAWRGNAAANCRIHLVAVGKPSSSPSRPPNPPTSRTTGTTSGRASGAIGEALGVGRPAGRGRAAAGAGRGPVAARQAGRAPGRRVRPGQRAVLPGSPATSSPWCCLPPPRWPSDGCTGPSPDVARPAAASVVVLGRFTGK